jgi:hypothetical protein
MEESKDMSPLRLFKTGESLKSNEVKIMEYEIKRNTTLVENNKAPIKFRDTLLELYGAVADLGINQSTEFRFGENVHMYTRIDFEEFIKTEHRGTELRDERLFKTDRLTYNVRNTVTDFYRQTSEPSTNSRGLEAPSNSMNF